MKKFIKLILIFHLAFILNSQLIISQETANKINFIQLDDNKGYLIDSLENLNCKCLPVTGRLFLYAALVQLPDSSIVLRIKNENILGFTEIKLRENDINNIYAKKLDVYAKKLINGPVAEYDLLRSLVRDTTKFQLIHYEEVNIPINMRKKLYGYLNLGLGSSVSPVYIIESGILYKKNIFSIGRNLNILKDNSPDYYYKNFGNINGYTEIALLYGRYINVESGIITFTSGIAYNKIEKGDSPARYIYEVKTFNTIGLPLKIGVSFFPQNFMGIGFSVFADFNNQSSFGGFVLCFRFGRLKSKFY
jgi:hypothetical protein